METSILIGSPSPRAQQVRNFLKQNNLQAWIAWRPEELLMLSGYFPFWGASFLIHFADAEPVLFVPQIEPRDHIPCWAASSGISLGRSQMLRSIFGAGIGDWN